MDRLPNELADAILQDVSKSDIKNLRLASRSLADVGAPHLFPRIWLSSHPLDVQVFRTIIRNPLICRGIKELIWDDTTYCDSLMERDNYMETVKHVASWGTWCWDLYPDQEDGAGYRLFLEKARLHHYIRRRRIDEKLLIKALPLLTNLRSVVLSSRHHYMPFPDDGSDVMNSPTTRQWKRERRFKTFTYPPTVNWKTVREPGDIFEPTKTELLQMMNVDYHKDSWDMDEIENVSSVQVLRPFRGLLILLRALSNANTIEKFEIRPQYASKWGEDNDMVGISHYFFRERSKDLERFVAIARCLRRLHLVVSCEGSPQTEHHASAVATIERGNLTRALQAAQRLEELHMELPAPNVMGAFGSGTHFPHLKRFTLMQGIVEPLELVEFLKSHRLTMRSLSLSGCNSTTKSWALLFNHMKVERLHLLVEVDFLFEPDGVNWCRTMEQDDINAFFAGNGPVPLMWTPWRGSAPPPRF